MFASVKGQDFYLLSNFLKLYESTGIPVNSGNSQVDPV